MLLLALSVMLFSFDASALARRPAGQWAYFHFEGGQFVPGKPEAGIFVAVQDGVVPMVETSEVKLMAKKLPVGTGALAGICYVQSYGGKLKPAGGYHPVPMQEVQISTGDRPILTVQTDGNGFFATALPTGIYRVGKQGVEVKIESGTTRLLPLRVGKRMVD